MTPNPTPDQLREQVLARKLFEAQRRPPMSEQMAPGLLPDLDGCVHGIVQMEPHIRIQCDGCGHIHDGAPGKAAFAVLTCGIRFSPRRYHAALPSQRDTRRLCRDCRRTEWDDPTAEEASRDRAE